MEQELFAFEANCLTPLPAKGQAAPESVLWRIVVAERKTAKSPWKNRVVKITTSSFEVPDEAMVRAAK